MRFVSAYPKSNFESNFWISQTRSILLKTSNVRILIKKRHLHTQMTNNGATPQPLFLFEN